MKAMGGLHSGQEKLILWFQVSELGPGFLTLAKQDDSEADAASRGGGPHGRKTDDSRNSAIEGRHNPVAGVAKIWLTKSCVRPCLIR